MQAPVTPSRAPTSVWEVVDVFVLLAAFLIVAIVFRHAFVVMPWSISHAFALDNPLPGVASSFNRFERVAAMGVSASLFLLGYGLIRKMASRQVNLTPFVVVSATMMAFVFSSVATWRSTPSLSWTRPDAEDISRQVWSAYAWSTAQSKSMPGWAGTASSTHLWSMPGGLSARIDSRGEMARVSVLVSAGLSCQYLLDELSNQSLPAGSELRVDRRVIGSRGYGDACHGDRMKEILLVSEKWPE